MTIAIVLSVILLVGVTVLAMAAYLEQVALRDNKTPTLWVARINDFFARYPYFYG